MSGLVNTDRTDLLFKQCVCSMVINICGVPNGQETNTFIEQPLSTLYQKYSIKMCCFSAHSNAILWLVLHRVVKQGKQ